MDVMDEQGDIQSRWQGREVFDADAKPIGRVVGPGHPRRKFGATWLLIETAGGRTVLVPAEHMNESGERLVLPYPKAYVEAGPTGEPDRPLPPEDERRLRFHYGLGSGTKDMGCLVGCGLCMINKREKHRRSAG